MGDWFSIIILILIGLVLIYLEIVFIPGTTVLGILGLIVVGIGVYITYDAHGTSAGTMVLGGALVLTVISLYYSFKKKSWNRFALKTQNKGRVRENYTSGLEVGMTGQALSDLKPIGKADFEDKTYEVTTLGGHVDSGDTIKIISLKRNKIIVESTKD